MTLEELLAVAEIVEKLTNRYRDQEAAHKAALTEIRASCNARTSADEKIIEGLRAEIIRVNEAHGRTKVENDGLLDELAAQRDAFTAEVAALKSQTPKHPAKVGEWVKAPLGTRGKVVSLGVDYLEVELTNGPPTRWWPVYMCEPCDPPEATAKLAPKVGDTVRLVTHPERAQVAKHLRTALQWPWMPSWGLVGQTGKVVKPLVAVAGAVAVALDGSTIFARWPIDCLEVVSDATHDTEAGKAAAESALKTELVAEEIKVGDVVEVVSNTGRNTWLADVGSVGTVVTVEEINDSISVHLENIPGKKNALAGYVSFCDVRKVTT